MLPYAQGGTNWLAEPQHCELNQSMIIWIGPPWGRHFQHQNFAFPLSTSAFRSPFMWRDTSLLQTPPSPCCTRTHTPASLQAENNTAFLAKMKALLRLLKGTLVFPPKHYLFSAEEERFAFAAFPRFWFPGVWVVTQASGYQMFSKEYIGNK